MATGLSTPLARVGVAIVKNSQYEKRCKECFTITVSEKPLENGEPCEPCEIMNQSTKNSHLVDDWIPKHTHQ